MHSKVKPYIFSTNAIVIQHINLYLLLHSKESKPFHYRVIPVLLVRISNAKCLSHPSLVMNMQWFRNKSNRRPVQLCLHLNFLNFCINDLCLRFLQ